MFSSLNLTPLLIILNFLITPTLATPLPFIQLDEPAISSGPENDTVWTQAITRSLLTKRYNSVLIESNRRPGQCIGTEFVRGPRPSVSVSLVDCGSDQALYWDIQRDAAGQVKVSGAGNLVLDAGVTPANFGRLTTEQYVAGKAGQNWYYTNDDRIAITGGDQCLDDDGSRLQTWRCTTGNTNQIFKVKTDGGPNPPYDHYPSIPHSTIYLDQGPDARRIHPLNRGDLCLTVLGLNFGTGNSFGIAYCFPDSNPLVQYQLFDAQATFSRVAGPLRMSRNNFYCVSSERSNGAGATLQTCTDAKKWQWDNGAGRFLNEGNTYCLDVRAESRPDNQQPINPLRAVQAWECGVGNPQQQWTFLW